MRHSTGCFTIFTSLAALYVYLRIRLEIRDQGKGMAPVEDHDSTNFGVGLFGIRERIRQLKGRLQIVSGHGQGTAVIASVPDSGKPAFTSDAVQATSN